MQAVLKMLSEIGSVENIPEFIEGVKSRYICLHLTGLVTGKTTLCGNFV